MHTTTLFLVTVILETVYGFPLRTLPRRNGSFRLVDTVLFATEKDEKNGNVNFALLEQEVIASAQERIDIRRVTNALLETDTSGQLQRIQESAPPAQWKIALAASAASSAVSFLALQNVYVSVLLFVLVFLAANGDPLEEDNLAGALARIVGRFTIKSVQASQPKVRALAKAVITGEEEIELLKNRIKDLEDENERLRTWKQRRIRVDELLPNYTVEELKELARTNGLPVGGTKTQLLLRLVETDVI